MRRRATEYAGHQDNDDGENGTHHATRRALSSHGHQPRNRPTPSCSSSGALGFVRRRQVDPGLGYDLMGAGVIRLILQAIAMHGRRIKQRHPARSRLGDVFVVPQSREIERVHVLTFDHRRSASDQAKLRPSPGFVTV
jgi:hypothetical protein